MTSPNARNIVVTKSKYGRPRGRAVEALVGEAEQELVANGSTT